MRLPEAPFRPLVLLAGLLAVGGCDLWDDDGSSSDVSDAPPAFDGDTAVSGTGPTITLEPAASDPDDDVLGFTWTYRDGPLNLPTGAPWPAVENQQADGTAELRFPVTGDYTMRVIAENSDGGTASRDIAVEVTGSTFRIEGAVEDDGSPSGGIDIELRWQPLATRTVLTDTTAGGDGAFAFTDLVAEKNGFAVAVAGDE